MNFSANLIAGWSGFLASWKKPFRHLFFIPAGSTLVGIACYQTTAPFNLADAPMPRFELLDVSRYNRITIQTSRGCSWNCEFCAASIRLNPKYRTKPVEKVIAELHRIKMLWPAPFIEFADDNTFADRRHRFQAPKVPPPQTRRGQQSGVRRIEVGRA